MKAPMIIENMNDLNQHFMPFKINVTIYYQGCERLSIVVKSNLEISST